MPDRRTKRAKPTKQKKPLTKEEFHRHLVEIGLMNQLPDTDADFEDPDDRLIDIKGEPLSETVIRERRSVAVNPFDSTAIVKRYVQEPGTAWVQGLAQPRAGHLIYVAHITGVEVCSAIVRRVLSGTVAPPAAAVSLARFRLDLSQEYLVLEITAPLLTDAMRLVEAHGLRAYGAVRLAAALELNGR